MNFDLILGIIIFGVIIFLIFKYKDTIKQKLQERIEKNAVKIPDLTYVDRSGNTIREDIIVKRSLIPIIGDWGRIYPPVDEDSKADWIYLLTGGKKNFIKLLVVLGIVAMILFAFYEIFSQYTALKESCILLP